MLRWHENKDGMGNTVGKAVWRDCLRRRPWRGQEPVSRLLLSLFLEEGRVGEGDQMLRGQEGWVSRPPARAVAGPPLPAGLGSRSACRAAGLEGAAGGGAGRRGGGAQREGLCAARLPSTRGLARSARPAGSAPGPPAAGGRPAAPSPDHGDWQ